MTALLKALWIVLTVCVFALPLAAAGHCAESETPCEESAPECDCQCHALADCMCSGQVGAMPTTGHDRRTAAHSLCRERLSLADVFRPPIAA